MPRWNSLIALSLALACGRDSKAPRLLVPIVEQFVTTPDSVRLYYRVAGDKGPTVLAPFALFHGTALDSLGTKFRIVTYDPRGRGRSDPVSPEKISLGHLLLDLETVRRAVGAEQMAIIGWSGAGMETFVYALRNPTRVTRLVQLAPVAPRFAPYGALMMADRGARTDSVAAEQLRARVATSGFGSDTAAWCRAAAGVTGPPLLADPTRPPPIPDVCGYPNEYPPRLDRYFGALFRSIEGFDWRDSLARVTIPRLVIHGAQDNTPIEGNREWVAGQPNARILVIDGAGHWPHYEQPRVTRAAIEVFLAGGWPDGAVAR